MLVEDNPADALLVRKALEEHGVEGEIMIFVDGERAIRFVQSIDGDTVICPDLFIVDLNLPRRPGRDVIESIRLNEKCQSVAVVVLSSSDAPRDKADATRLGATLYLRKPSRLEAFLGLGAVLKQALPQS